MARRFRVQRWLGGTLAAVALMLASAAWWRGRRPVPDEGLGASIRTVLPMAMPTANGLGRPRRVTQDRRAAWLWPVLSDGVVVGLMAVGSSLNGYGGALTVAVGLGGDGTVGRVMVMAHRETPGIGGRFGDLAAHDDTGEASAGRAMLDRLRGRGMATAPWRLSCDGGDVDAVSGATVTSRAVIEAVNHAVGAARQVHPDS